MKVWVFLGVAFLLTCQAQSVSFRYVRQDYVSDLKIQHRDKTISTTLLYPEMQYKYGLFQNFLGMYVDRPLFYNREYRYPAGSFSYTSEQSYCRDMKIVRSYGFDGAGSLSDSSLHLYRNICGYLREHPERFEGHREFIQLSQFSSSPAVQAKLLAHAREVLKLALKSQFTPRINGRIPISTYYAYRMPSEKIKDFISVLRKEFGEVFYLTCELNVEHDDCRQFYRTGYWETAIVEKYRRKLHDLLDLFDGVQIVCETNRRDFNYMTMPDFRIYDKYLEPMIRACQNNPRFRRKLYGAVIRQGYVNHMSGVTHGEFGTWRLRGVLDRLVRLNPDFLVFFEWNEFNENTCYQPTLRNSLALQRLIRFYSNLLHGRPPEANPGDDRTLPMLVFSSREEARVSEVVQFELLNIPDSLDNELYQVVLELQNLAGQRLALFPAETLNRAVLRAVTYQVPMEQFSTERAVRPVLTVTDSSGRPVVFDQLQSVRLQPTICRVYQENRQSIRDLLRPVRADWKTEMLGNGACHVRAEFDAGVPLASLELLDHGAEIAAVDRTSEFDRTKYHIVSAVFSTPNRTDYLRKCVILVENAPGWKFRPWEQANISFGKWKQNGDTMTSFTHFSKARNRVLLMIPKTAEKKAVIHCDLAGEKMTLSLRDLLAAGRFTPDFSGIRADWEIYHRLPDIPPHIGTTKAVLDTVLTPEFRYPLLQLRAVTVNGKIYRSALRMPVPLPDTSEMMNLYSEATGKIVRVPVLSRLVPHLLYRIDPSLGMNLSSQFESRFHAELGGGFYYDESPYRMPIPRFTSVTPKFSKDEKGRNILAFQNISYVNFPSEAFPRGNFRLVFEVKPSTGNGSYVLFRHFSWILGSISVYTKNNRLYLTYGDHHVKVHKFETGLEIEPEKWSAVEIAFNQKYLKFEVNKRKKLFTVPEPMVPLYFKPAMFGGHLKKEFGVSEEARFFSGLLRRLEIHHSAGF